MASADILRAARVEHTPGPWETGSKATGSDPRMVYCNDATGQRVADCTGEYLFHSDETMRANARLIAAAPTMLQALKSLDAWWTDSFPAGPDAEDISYGFGKLSEDTLVIWRQVRAAIAAAEREAGQ